MDYKLTSLAAVLERAGSRLRSPEGGVRLWPTGFPLLDDAIGGGFRSGTLNLIAGPQGQGKTMFAMQAARAAVKTGRSAVFFSYELEADALTQRLVAMEAARSTPTRRRASVRSARSSRARPAAPEGSSSGWPPPATASAPRRWST